MTSKANEIEKISKEIYFSISGANFNANRKLCDGIARDLINTFHIIPRTDSPEKHVEIGYYFNHFKHKLKWRENK